jgi:enoyl-CoA hydratase/carnithine racemase
VKQDGGSFCGQAAVLARYVSVCCQLWHGLLVPVYAVLDGCVSGAGLAIALSADYRVATSTARFDLRDLELSSLMGVTATLGQIVGDAQL